jgi:hypothetical protein
VESRVCRGACRTSAPPSVRRSRATNRVAGVHVDARSGPRPGHGDDLPRLAHWAHGRGASPPPARTTQHRRCGLKTAPYRSPEPSTGDDTAPHECGRCDISRLPREAGDQARAVVGRRNEGGPDVQPPWHDNGQMSLTCGFARSTGSTKRSAQLGARDREESHVSFPGPIACRHKSSGAIRASEHGEDPARNRSGKVYESCSMTESTTGPHLSASASRPPRMPSGLRSAGSWTFPTTISLRRPSLD